MRRRALVYLHDVRSNALLIQQSVRGKVLADYERDVRLQHQTEREFMIIGEALARLDQLDGELAGQISDYRGYIGLRNILNHRYPDVDNPTVWRTIEIEIPTLLRDVEALILALSG